MASRALHPESLLHLRLVRHLLTDPCVRLRRRGVDARWRYARLLTSDYQGFNPFSATVYYARHSKLEAWLREPRASARAHNVKDQLVNELLFAVHDYLHVWAYHWIKTLCPQVGLGEAPITSNNIEDLVFCHLLTEAAATVGLDYWYLSTIDINDVCPIGTRVKQLTISYRREHEAEYTRFDERFCVQRPSFFVALATFYCSGVFLGFDRRDIERSPLLYGWLSHELSYGAAQRAYARSWFGSLSRRPIHYDGERARARVSTRAPWKRALLTQLGALLHRKVNNDEVLTPPKRLNPSKVWRSAEGGPYDFRFHNYNVVARRERAHLGCAHSAESFHYLVRQMVARLDFGRAYKRVTRLMDAFERERDPVLVERVLRGEPKVAAGRDEPRDLLFLS